MAVFWRRWLFLVLGGALFTPYAILAMVAVPIAVPGLARVGSVTLVVVVTAVMLVAIGVTSLLPSIRTLEGAVAPGLLDGPAAGLDIAPVRTRGDRVRNTIWYLTHTVTGAVVSVASVVVPPVAVSLIVGAVRGNPTIGLGTDPLAIARGWAVPLALALLAALLLVVWVTGTAAAWSAPRLLGPDQSARLAQLERRTRELTERTRLARELHDSIGHALTVTTLQASAARTVLHSDPNFAEQALRAIEQTGRVAAADLDDFLGLLREDRAARAPQPTLHDLPALVAAHREVGLPVRLDVAGDLDQVAAVVSREAYRIVQEGLTNVQRHAGIVDTAVNVSAGCDALTVEVRNAAPSTAPLRNAPTTRNARAPGDAPTTRGAAKLQSGGRGLDGTRERVELLGGSYHAGPQADGWLLSAIVPSGVVR